MKIFDLISIKQLNVIFIIVVIDIFSFLFKEHIYEVFEPLNLNYVKQNEYFLLDKNKHYNNHNCFRKKKKISSYYFTKFSFNVTSIRYSIESQNNLVKVEYLIDFFDQRKNLIIPSDLNLYYDYHILCYNKDIKANTFITSLANIYENKHYYCTEFINKNDNIKFGIKIYKISNGIEFYSFDFFIYTKEVYDNYIYNNTISFNYSLINEKFNKLIEKMHNDNLDYSLRLKESYIQKPIYSTKNNIGKKNKWLFRNIYNYYFCFCKGKNCLFYDIPQKCKYYFYLNIIDNNKHIYNKTDYLFGDFFYNKFSSDDVYPIFSKMIDQKFSAHYMTQKEKIIEKYCQNKNICLTIINDDFIDGDFLEKYLTLILRLKVVVSGAEFFSIDNLFYNIDYITYISVGHGVSFFKHFLYSEHSYYGSKKFNQILIPPSEKLISMAKHYGWKNKDIIKMNLPRWDKYNDFENIIKEESINNKNIFVMFTWRLLKEKKEISKLYFENINELLNNNLLLKELEKYNISLYFTFHRQVWDKSKLKLNKYIKYIEEKEISNILSNTSLLVTDFSSIIFDIIYREKPFVIFIPDSNDPTLNDIYSDCYCKLIKDIKDGTISFQNTFFSIEDTVNKINYYIKNNFYLEPKLKNFYTNFGFKKENNTNKFIEYLLKIK